MTTSNLRMIVSGGQTGVDRGAIGAASTLGFPYGGWIPEGRKAEDGQVPACFEELTVLPGAGYAARTKKNVHDSDATLIINNGHELTGGTKMTMEVAQDQGVPMLLLDASFALKALHARPPAGVPNERWYNASYVAARDVLSAQITIWLQVKWLGLHPIHKLNVAGPRESKAPGIELVTFDLISRVIPTRSSA